MTVELTDKQITLLQLVASGATMQEMAKELDLGYETIRTHIDRLKKRVGAENKLALAVWAVREGIA